MATLVKNVWVDGKFYGPDHGGDDALPPEVAARITDPACWGAGVMPTSPASSTASDPPAPGQPEPQQVEADPVAPPSIDGFGWLTDPNARPALELAEALDQASIVDTDLLADLAELPDDEGDLRAFADLCGLDLQMEGATPGALRDAITQMLGGTVPDTEGTPEESP